MIRFRDLSAEDRAELVALMSEAVAVAIARRWPTVTHKPVGDGPTLSFCQATRLARCSVRSMYRAIADGSVTGEWRPGPGRGRWCVERASVERWVAGRQRVRP